MSTEEELVDYEDEQVQVNDNKNKTGKDVKKYVNNISIQIFT